jgi:peptide/nickel transport system substrate-binding protein
MVLLMAIALPLSACSIDSFRTEASQIPRIVIASANDPKTFNYALNQSVPNVFDFLYEGLVGEDGVTGEPYPALAESWEISDDKLSILFTLREGLRWSDGEPLTADDVLFSFNQVYLNEAIPTPIRDVLTVGVNAEFPTLEKVSDRQIRVTVPEPFAPLLSYLGTVPILPKHALEASITTNNDDGEPLFLSTWGTDTDPRQVVGNGPYRMVSYAPAERLVFERNPYYWKTDAQGKQQPYVEQLIWQIVESVDTALLQFRAGGVDTIGISARTFMLLKKEEDKGNFTIYNGGPDLSKFFVMFNLNQGKRQDGTPLIDPIKARWFNTVAFRQAIAYAIDRQTIINNLLLGLGATQNSPLPEQSPYYLSPEEGLPVYDYNPEKSKELLLASGFQYNDANLLLDADGNEVRFTVMTNTGGRLTETVGAQLKQNLSEIGIQIDFQPVEFNTLLERLRNTLDWETYIGGITGGLEPHGESTIWALDGSLHTFNRQPQPGQDPLVGQVFADWEREISELFVQGSQELDIAKRKEIYGKAQILIQENVPMIYLVNPLVLGAVRNTIQGVRYSAIPDWNSLWNIEDLKISMETPT